MQPLYTLQKASWTRRTVINSCMRSCSELLFVHFVSLLRCNSVSARFVLLRGKTDDSGGARRQRPLYARTVAKLIGVFLSLFAKPENPVQKPATG